MGTKAGPILGRDREIKLRIMINLKMAIIIYTAGFPISVKLVYEYDCCV